MRLNIRQWFEVISALLCITLSLCYGLRPDACAAVTFFPAWIWLVPGILFLLPTIKVQRKKWLFAVFAMWAVFTLVFNEEPHSMLRTSCFTAAQFRSMRRQGKAARVITLNCAGGNENAVEEVKKYRPDIVLLQESPGKSDVMRLARKLFGNHYGYACSADNSIIACGPVKPHSLSKDSRLICASARIQLHSGLELEAISLRLVPPIVRPDLWSPNCWHDHAESRCTRRDQAQFIASVINKLPAHMPIVVGGDFNAPAGDGIFTHLRPRMHDSFAEHGVGWGNTVLNDFPVQRVDQIWVDRHFRAVSARAYKTRHSDHRLVVCDLMLK